VQKAEAENDPELYDMAIALATQAIEIDKTSSRGFYNRACYRLKVSLLRKTPLEEAELLADLEKSFNLDPRSDLLAQYDPVQDSAKQCRFQGIAIAVCVQS
jgi:hypothetical protein